MELTRDLKTEDQVEDNAYDEYQEDTQGDAEDLRNYMLGRDRTRRTITPPSRFGTPDMVYYALAVAEQLEFQEPANYKEEMSCSERAVGVGHGRRIGVIKE